MWLSWLNGLLICAGLIVAIGAQNAFVLQQSLRRQHAWMVAGVCALCDWLLVGLGVLGLGVLIAQQDALMEAARWAGAAFLAGQAWLAFRRVLAGQALAAGGGRVQSWQAALAATLAVTLLNPQVYLETVVLLGAIGAVQPSPLGFFIGAAMASFGWFFGLAAAAGWLAPRLANPRVWRAIDLAIGIILAWVAWRLASGAMMP
ncbi:MAG: LysE family transporter [Halomonas sp.]|nr:LysE family transporter [Halomonas sp.]MDX5502322.1 LysE family transporter [Halomonas sp.]